MSKLSVLVAKAEGAAKADLAKVVKFLEGQFRVIGDQDGHSATEKVATADLVVIVPAKDGSVSSQVSTEALAAGRTVLVADPASGTLAPHVDEETKS